MLRIDQTYLIHAAPERVWAALTDAVLIVKWSGTRAEYDARSGGAYVLWDGYVRGKILTCAPPQKLAQTWQPRHWAISNSVVTFTLRKTRGGTRLELTHENIPPAEFDDTLKNWNEFYIGAIQVMLQAETRQTKTKRKRRDTRAAKTTRPRQSVPRARKD